MVRLDQLQGNQTQEIALNDEARTLRAFVFYDGENGMDASGAAYANLTPAGRCA